MVGYRIGSSGGWRRKRPVRAENHPYHQQYMGAKMPDKKPKYTYDLVIVTWENGEGLLIYTSGWLIHRDKDVTLLCSQLELKNGAEWVTEGYHEIPTPNIHDTEVVQKRW